MNDTRVPEAGTQALRVLIAYFLVLESLHVVLILWAGARFMLTGVIGFPAKPPPAGWPGDVIPWLLGNGVLDLFFAAAGLIFGVRYFRGRRLWFRWGLISLSGALYSAGVFAIGTIPSGAWTANPLSYGLLAAAFSPILPLLMILLASTADHAV